MATIRKRGNRWQVQVRRKTAPQISRSFLTKADAETWARSMEVKVDRRALGHDPRQLDSITLSDLVIRYRDTISPSKKGGDIEVCRLNAFLRHPMARLSLSSVSTSAFAAYRDQRLEEISPSSLLRELAPLQHMFAIAYSEWGIPIRDNPISYLRKPSCNPPRTRRLRQGEYDKLLDAASKCRVGYMIPSIIIAVETAMRRGEILSIKAEHYDRSKGRLRIPQTKTGKPRAIYLQKSTEAALRGLLDAFSASPSQLSPNAFRLTWQRTVERASIEDLHFHDLRHEAVSRLFEQGLSIPQVAAISGHKDFRMLARYTHL